MAKQNDKPPITDLDRSRFPHEVVPALTDYLADVAWFWRRPHIELCILLTAFMERMPWMREQIPEELIQMDYTKDYIETLITKHERTEPRTKAEEEAERRICRRKSPRDV